MMTPIEIAWFATYFHGGATEFLNGELMKAVGGREYSPHERDAALRAVANYRPEGDPVADPVFGALATIHGHTPHERVRDAAFAAFGGLLADAAGVPYADGVVHHTLLAAAIYGANDGRATAGEARGTARRVIDYATAHRKEAAGPAHDPVQIAWALVRIYAREDWDGTAEPGHELMQDVAPEMLAAAREYEPGDVFTDPVLRTLVHVAQQFDAAGETGAGDVALGAARALIAKGGNHDRFALGLLVRLVHQRHTGELGVASARAIFDTATHLHSART